MAYTTINSIISIALYCFIFQNLNLVHLPVKAQIAVWIWHASMTENLTGQLNQEIIRINIRVSFGKFGQNLLAIFYPIGLRFFQNKSSYLLFRFLFFSLEEDEDEDEEAACEVE
jgi:hypothetical protein